MTTYQYAKLRKAILKMDFEQVDTLLAQDYTLNCVNAFDETLFSDILDEILWDKSPHACTMTQELLRRGADPNFRNSEHTGVLSTVILQMANDVVRILLEAGANPNAEGTDSPDESFYDYAVFDYMFQVYDGHLPEEPSEADTATPDSWLHFLDRLAVKYKRRRPDYLVSLREFGAKTMRELHHSVAM